jgi:hypothetical protein
MATLREDTEHRHCRGGRDGECVWKLCPQIRDGEPTRSERHCPLDTRNDDGDCTAKCGTFDQAPPTPRPGKEG